MFNINNLQNMLMQSFVMKAQNNPNLLNVMRQTMLQRQNLINQQNQGQNQNQNNSNMGQQQPFMGQSQFLRMPEQQQSSQPQGKQ